MVPMGRLDDFDLVIFDCDGVVVDSEILSCGCLAEAFQSYGVPLGLDDVIERFIGQSPSAVDIYWRTELKQVPPASFFADHRNRLKAAFATDLKPMPRVDEVLTRLAQPFCVASSSELERLRFTLSVTKLDVHFAERVFSASMVANGKPAPDLFLLAAREMNRAPGRALVIEDSVSGVRAGKAAAMTVWGFVGGSHCQGRDVAAQLVAAGADRIFDSLAELLPQ
jgi:HAD superfamily hydrolase (TIGR01509 family)